MFKSINPFTLETIAEFAVEKDLDYKINLSGKVYSDWSQSTISNRIKLFGLFAQELEKNKSIFAKIISLEMGKTLKEAEGEISKCIVTIGYYSENIEKILQATVIKSSKTKSYFTYEPTGTILAIMPWNYPFWQVLRFAIPNLLLGNTVLLKHAPNVLWTAKTMAETFEKSGFPKGVFQNIIIDVSDVEKVIASEHVKGVTLTGSSGAGSSVAALAGKYLKKSVLELGGSDPFIVLKDADQEKVITVATKSRFQNAGQTCIAAKRWIVEESIYDAIKEGICDEIKKINVGNPLKEATTMGPMARIDLAEKIETQVNKLIKIGAKSLTKWERNHCLIQPQILEITPEIAANYQEEIFGPVGIIIKAKDQEDAIKVANKTRYGLGASLWTADLEKGEELMRKINAGSVFLNGMVKSEAAIPFGGINNSGYGRELGTYGVNEFSNIKSYVIV